MRTTTRPARTLAVRLDSAGDVLILGPAVRAMAESGPVDLLVGPGGADAARLLPGVDDVHVWTCPWIVADAPRVDERDLADLVDRLRGRYAHAVVFTSFHQSALPTALLLRLAGVGRITAFSEDYPGALLDDRVMPPDDVPEPERALMLARHAGFGLPAGDTGELAVRVGQRSSLRAAGPYVAVHPGTSVPARGWPRERWRECVRMLVAAGRRVVVTGSASERDLTHDVAGDAALDLGGRTSFAELAAVIAGAEALVVANTGPAHLAAAVGTPVVSLFAPTVPAARWAPYRVPSVLLGDQDAPCRGTRAKTCPVPGHPCLGSVHPSEVLDALDQLAGPPAGTPPDPLRKKEMQL
ncbi:glycosyltransferase family 9 protein [Mumia zhuanghuii]|uniref:Glycosyltransferase family 9 protein n=1 Tax=Mumia zhuanghuii TaxID=2585211 RepID=A0A5C4MHA8_9ACTN|nr:glycosyltransferase family 9 protein [Mumia zhuanghuii]TNC36591.1 glycosyltransferase family 9 protein [Mumia zhuanghuii]TNC46356.1 glycosyltransferase family 9 protein [Mumia zhuanghuii]